MVVAAHSIPVAIVQEEFFESDFGEAYRLYPQVPRGLLEAIAFTRTRIRDVRPDLEEPSCAGLPGYWGPMGLVEDGQSWFRNSLQSVAGWSDVPAEVLKTDPRQQIVSYAEALYRQTPPGTGPLDPLDWDLAVLLLSELPFGSDPGSMFVLDSYLYGVFSALSDPAFSQKFNTPEYSLDLHTYFGPDRYALVTASTVKLNQQGSPPESSPWIDNDLPEESDDPEGSHKAVQPVGPGKLIEQMFSNDASDGTGAPVELRMAGPCYDYPGVSWIAADAGNYSSRAGTPISAVTIHTMQGYYAGTISWFQNPSANVSAHYCLRSSDGQITQMVCEADKAWHVGSENPYTVGLEHEGFVDDPSWYTSALYNASASLTRDIAGDAAINTLRTYFKAGSSGVLTLGGCTRIKGHQHFPGATHTDPGINWNWAHYYRLVNEPVSPIMLSGSSGSVYDPGGPTASYGDDQRTVTLIQPVGASSVTLSFSAFNLENNWDYLLIYDGNSVFAPLLGSFTGTSLPPTLTANSGSMTLEFRSDCATTAPGYAASWTSSGSAACATPAGTFTGPIGWTSATINWSPVSDAVQYQVAGRKAGLSAWRNLYTPLSAKWLGIFQEATSYEWRVRAQCSGGGWSAWSVTNTFTTNALRLSSVDSGALNLDVWPIPASGSVHVRWDGQGRVQLLNVLGQILVDVPATIQHQLDVSNLPSGWYCIRVGSPGAWLQRSIWVTN